MSERLGWLWKETVLFSQLQFVAFSSCATSAMSGYTKYWNGDIVLQGIVTL